MDRTHLFVLGRVDVSADDAIAFPVAGKILEQVLVAVDES
jgi:hypothetical protein